MRTGRRADPFFRAKALTEERLRKAELEETILAPNIFMEDAIPNIVFEPALETGEVTLVGEGRREHTWVSIDDVADLAVNVLGRPEAYGRRLRFGGPEAVTWRDIVDVAREVLDREIELRFVEPGQPIEGLSEFEVGVLAGTEEFDSPEDTRAVAETFDVPRTTVRRFAERWAAVHAGES